MVIRQQLLRGAAVGAIAVLAVTIKAAPTNDGEALVETIRNVRYAANAFFAAQVRVALPGAQAYAIGGPTTWADLFPAYYWPPRMPASAALTFSEDSVDWSACLVFRARASALPPLPDDLRNRGIQLTGTECRVGGKPQVLDGIATGALVLFLRRPVIEPRPAFSK